MDCCSSPALPALPAASRQAHNMDIGKSTDENLSLRIQVEAEPSRLAFNSHMGLADVKQIRPPCIDISGPLSDLMFEYGSQASAAQALPCQDSAHTLSCQESVHTFPYQDSAHTLSCSVVRSSNVIGAETSKIAASFQATSTQTSSSPGFTQSKTMIGNNVALRLTAARRHGQRRLLRLRAPTISLGSILILGGMWCFLLYQTRKQNAWVSLGPSLIWIGWICLLLSLTPSDNRCVPVVTSMGSFFLLASIFNFVNNIRDQIQMAQANRCFLHYRDDAQPCWLVVILLVTNSLFVLVATCCAIAFTIVAIVSWRSNNIASGFQNAWKVIRVISFSLTISWLSRLFTQVIANNYVAAGAFGFNMLVCLMGFIATRRYDIIVRIQSWLMSQGEAATAAAGVAELLGGQSPEAILASARKSFFCVKADKIKFEDICENTPNPQLAAFAEPAQLGHVDAFISHSWHDDPGMKWDALQKWRADFKRHHRKEANVWIDKYCIDQRNISDSLACLPVYLAGCKRLVVFCGSTYLRRLWCLIEIFVFLEMGAKPDNLDVHLLEHHPEAGLNGSGSHSLMTSTSVAKELRIFNSRNAECTSKDDTARLQNVLEVAGNDKIDDLINDVFLEKLAKRNFL